MAVVSRAQESPAPRVWSITTDTNTAATVQFTVVFSEPVTGVDATDFSTSGDDQFATITSVDTADIPTTYIVAIALDGPSTHLALNLFDDDSILNADGIPLGGAGINNGNAVSSVVTPTSASVTDTGTRFDVPHTNGIDVPQSTDHKVGRYTSIVLTSDDVPIISYFDYTNQDLKLAVCDDTNCNNPTISTIDATNDVGAFSSIALTTDGIPVIGYADTTDGSAKLAICNNAACTSPTISTVDSTNVVGTYLDLALTSDNKPVMSYLDSTNYNLMLAICNNAACTSPTISTIDNSDDLVGLNTSIAVNSSNIPIISYHDATNTSLKLAICNNTACTSPNITTLDSTGIVGEESSLAITSDNKPIISYFDGTNSDLKLAICNNATCTSPLISTVDSTGNVGMYTSLALTSDNNPIISYFDIVNGALKIATCDGIPCSSPSISKFDTLGMLGGYTSVALTSANAPIVSYYDGTNGNLKLYRDPIIIDNGAPNSFGKSTPTSSQLVTTASTTLTWASSTYADSYEYCYATSIATCTSWISTSTTASATITGLSHGTTYYWQVRATNTSGTTLADSGTPRAFTVALAPVTFAKSAPANNATNQKTSVALSWAASARATSYEYCIALTTATCTTWKSTGTARTITVTGLTKNKAYYWQVRAKNAGGTTLASTTYWKFTTAR